MKVMSVIHGRRSSISTLILQHSLQHDSSNILKASVHRIQLDDEDSGRFGMVIHKREALVLDRSFDRYWRDTPFGKQWLDLLEQARNYGLHWDLYEGPTNPRDRPLIESSGGPESYIIFNPSFNKEIQVGFVLDPITGE